MVGLILILAVLVFSAVAFGAGVDSREGSTDDRRPASPIGLELAPFTSPTPHPFRLAARRPRAWDGSSLHHRLTDLGERAPVDLGSVDVVAG